METDKQQQLMAWSGKWIPLFNELSKTYNTPYYTQSPLDKVDGDVDVMFVGVNPGGIGRGVSYYTPAQFLAGNPHWEERFIEDKNVWKFTNGARFFMGYDARRHPHTIDNDSRVVWSNLSPFVSKRGFTDLHATLRDEGIKSAVDLINRLQPKRILFLGGNAFQLLDQYADDSIREHIQHVRVYDNLPLEIGRVYDRPAYYVCHPSGQWPVSNSFTSVFIFLRDLYDVYENGKPLHSLFELRERMRKETWLWQKRIKMNK